MMVGALGVEQLIKEGRETGDAGLKPYDHQYLNQDKRLFYASLSVFCHVIFVAGQTSQNSWMAVNVQDPRVNIFHFAHRVFRHSRHRVHLGHSIWWASRWNPIALPSWMAPKTRWRLWTREAVSKMELLLNGCKCSSPSCEHVAADLSVLGSWTQHDHLLVV